MEIDAHADFEDLRRERDGRVVGSAVVKIAGEFRGTKFRKDLGKKEFSFVRGGERELLNVEVPVGLLKIRVSAKIHEHIAGLCCVQGNINVRGPIGSGIGKSFDAGCRTIPMD